MAKDKSKAKKEDKEEAQEFKFGVADIAEALDIKPASVRVQLRNKGIEKAGKSYGWNSKTELKEVIDQLKAGNDDGEKPAKKSSKKDEKSSKKDKGAKGKRKPADDDDD
jgi:hypothetical protein